MSVISELLAGAEKSFDSYKNGIGKGVSYKSDEEDDEEIECEYEPLLTFKDSKTTINYSKTKDYEETNFTSIFKKNNEKEATLFFDRLCATIKESIPENYLDEESDIAKIEKSKEDSGKIFKKSKIVRPKIIKRTEFYMRKKDPYISVTLKEYKDKTYSITFKIAYEK